MSGYWYLATLYTKHPVGLRSAFGEACALAGELIEAGVSVFSPIAHSHPIAMRCLMDPRDYRIWQASNRPLVEAAKGLIVVTAPGWEDSVGIADEMEAFAGRPIVLWNPEEPIPEEVRA